MFAIVVTPPSPVHKGVSGTSSSCSPSSTPSMGDDQLMKLSPSVQHFLQQQQQQFAIPQTRRPGERSLLPVSTTNTTTTTTASCSSPFSMSSLGLPSSTARPRTATSFSSSPSSSSSPPSSHSMSLSHSAPSSTSFSSLSCSTSSATTIPFDFEAEDKQLNDDDDDDDNDNEAVVRRKTKRNQDEGAPERFPSVLFPNSVSTDRNGYLLPPPHAVNLRSISHNDSFWCGYDSKESMSATAAAAAESDPRWDEVIDTAVIFAHLALNKQAQSQSQSQSHLHSQMHSHAALHSHMKPSLPTHQQPHTKRLHTHAYNHNYDDNNLTASITSSMCSTHLTQANEADSHTQPSYSHHQTSGDDCDCECDAVEQVKSIHTDEDLDDALRDI